MSKATTKKSIAKGEFFTAANYEECIFQAVHTLKRINSYGYTPVLDKLIRSQAADRKALKDPTIATQIEELTEERTTTAAEIDKAEELLDEARRISEE